MGGAVSRLARTEPKPWSSTTARPTAPSRSCGSAIRTCASSRRRTAGSARAGTSACARLRAPYVLLLNADAWLVDGALEHLLDFAELPAARCGGRATPAEPRRDAAALRARLPDGVAARDRVPLPPQARAGLVGAQRLLRRRLRPRRGARGRGGDGRLHARSVAVPSTRSASATRTTSSSARRRTGASASARPAGRSCSSPAPSASTFAARRTEAASTARTCAGTCSSSRSTAARRWPSARDESCSRRSGSAGSSSEASAAGRTARARRGSRPATRPRSLER